MFLEEKCMENSLSEQILKVLENNSRLTNQEIAMRFSVPSNWACNSWKFWLALRSG